MQIIHEYVPVPDYIKKDALIKEATVFEDGGHRRWTGELSRVWGYPVVFVGGFPLNVHMWLAPKETKARGYVNFYKQSCDLDGVCINPRHQTLNESVPVGTVKAMERMIRAEAA